MSKSKWLVGATLVFGCWAACQAGPVGGPGPRRVEIRGGTAENPASAAFEQAFQGGQRACVIALNDDRDVETTLGVTVLDAKGEVITQSMGGRLAAAIWYPPREATYRIVISSTAAKAVQAYVVSK